MQIYFTVYFLSNFFFHLYFLSFGSVYCFYLHRMLLLFCHNDFQVISNPG